jgi:hypothetical protein
MLNKKKIFNSILIFSTLMPILANAQQFISVKFGVVRSVFKENNVLAANDNDFTEAAINYAIGENSKKLASCGYKLDYVPYFFDQADILSAKEAASYIESKNAWFLIGPDRSDFFLLTVNGLKKTPAISLMAGSKAVTDLLPPIFTMYPNNNELTKAAFYISQKEHLGKTYGAFVDATCDACKDFASEFDKISNKKLVRKFQIDSGEDNPDLSVLLNRLATTKIDFLLLPNFSKLSGYVMSQVHKAYPEIKFLGASGWGAGDYNFIVNYNLSNDTIAYSARIGLPPEKLEELYGVYSLDRQWNGKVSNPPMSSFLTIQLLSNITDQLCKSKPKNQSEFYQYLAKQKSDLFKAKIGIAAYKIINSEPTYWTCPY